MANQQTQGRIERLRALAETAPDRRPEAFEQARLAAADPDREVRAAAAEAVAVTGDPAASLGLLARLAKDADTGVRHAAVAAVAGLPWSGRFELLNLAMGDPDTGVVAVAADGLSYAGDRRAAPVLRALVAEKQLQFTALEGLYALKDPDLEMIARPLFAGFLTPLFEKTVAALALARSGDVEALQHIRRRVRKRFAAERRFILMHLLQADPAEGRVLVEAAATSGTDDQRESALLALTRVEPARWWPTTEAALRECLTTDLDGAAEVLLTLGEIDAVRALPLAQELRDRQDLVGAAARKVVLRASLLAAFPQEVRQRCA